MGLNTDLTTPAPHRRRALSMLFKGIAAVSFASFFGLAKAQDFTAGQVWAYKTRGSETGSTLLIDRVDIDSKFGEIFHVSVFDLRVKNPRAAGGITTSLPHFPVSRTSLALSCTKLVGRRDPDPAYLDGYGAWRKAFDEGRAGVFSISVADIVAGIETSLNQ
jgi:hypothetical protein